jgi:hypothetical protein
MLFGKDTATYGYSGTRILYRLVQETLPPGAFPVIMAYGEVIPALPCFDLEMARIICDPS